MRFQSQTEIANLPHLPVKLATLRPQFSLPSTNSFFRRRSIEETIYRLHHDTVSRIETDDESKRLEIKLGAPGSLQLALL
jgi:hypothetical protein